ncbi:unnamed protein product [Triticum turgidum subsp. durum]|uniref:Uncharacterized protein n=1 Tax=Triticum turgidum subsp. durum TaxID=4567 RepID=A0A9R0WL25_TRITD|nr:unnamed protein product [Triticum turgidum subsp. durum]
MEHVKFDVLLYLFFTLHDNSWQRTDTPYEKLRLLFLAVTPSTKDAHGVLVERDPSYDDMLKHMVGRITTKPGGKPEMGEASVVERYNRPLPKVRTSEPEPGQSRQLPPGTLNVGHIQEIIQLYQGKSSSHRGPMSVDQIASRFRVEASVVHGIVQFVSLPQDEGTEKKDERRDL